MLKRKDHHIIYGTFRVSFFQVFGHHRYRAGAGTASRTRNQQEGIRLGKAGGAPYRIYNLVTILFGYLGTKLVYLAYSVATRLLTPDEDSMLVVRLDKG